MTRTVPSSLLILVIVLALASVLFLGLTAMPGLILVPCVHPVAQDVALSASIAVVLTLAASRLWGCARFGKPGSAVGLVLLLVGLSLWLGSYRYSALSFAGGRLQILRGFAITRAASPQQTVAPGAILSLTSTSVIGIQVLTGLAPVQCKWMSENGGTLDSNDTGDTVYTPPQHSETDHLVVLANAGCGLGTVRSEIRIIVLP